MLATFFYLLVILLLILFLLFMIIYTIALFYSSYMGAPFVPTRQKELKFILKEAGLKKDKVFLELGCGDGRVVRTAANQYKVIGYGIDINPFIIIFAKFLANIQKINCIFLVKNLFEFNYSRADYIYLFLMPNMLKKLVPIFKRDLKKNTIVISHGFKLIGCMSKLYRTIQHEPFPTYFYRF